MNLHELSIAQLTRLLEGKKTSPEEIYTSFLTRIKEINPKINAYLTVINKPELDYSMRDKPLFGIPYSMKDTYNTKGIRTTAAAKVLDNYISPYDATAYTKLKKAGAVLIGKTNCDAWGHGSSTENSDFGPTKNPWNRDYVPGGSSGGSAASLAADLCSFSIGEDTGGSIRLPASFCSVVGLKPTYGLVSRYGCIAYASSLDTVGPMARSVEDTALVLEVLAGADSCDATTSQSKPPRYSQFLGRKIAGLKMGIPKEYFMKGMDDTVASTIAKAMKDLQKLGVEPVEISLPMTEYAISTYYLIAPSETSSNLARYDGIRFGKTRRSFGAEAKRRIMLGTFTLSHGYYDAYYKKATKVRTLIKNDFENAFKAVDFIIAPASPTPPFKLGEKVDDPLKMYLSDIYLVSVNLAGVPALSVPCGFTGNKLPISFQLIGRHFDETTLLNIGYQYEQVHGIYERPRIK